MLKCNVKFCSNTTAVMRKLHGFLLLIYYESVSAAFFPVTKFPGPTQPLHLPSELTEDDLYRLKIPNRRFCEEMERKFQGKYLVVPWLFQNCQDLKEDIAKNRSGSVVLPVHKAVIDKIHFYRRNGLLKYNSKNKIPPIFRRI